MPLYEKLSVNPRTRWLAYLLEAFVPIVLACTIAWVVIIQVNDNARFDAAARADRIAACGAVAASNVATVSFLRTRIASTATSPANAAAGQLFVDGLQAAYKVADAACLAKK